MAERGREGGKEAPAVGVSLLKRMGSLVGAAAAAAAWLFPFVLNRQHACSQHAVLPNKWVWRQQEGEAAAK